MGLEKNREGGNGCLLNIKSYFLKAGYYSMISHSEVWEGRDGRISLIYWCATLDSLGKL